MKVAGVRNGIGIDTHVEALFMFRRYLCFGALLIASLETVAVDGLNQSAALVWLVSTRGSGSTATAFAS